MPVDKVRPLLASATPSDDGTGVAPGATIELTFTEAVKAGVGKIYVTNGATQTYLGKDGTLQTRIVNATDTRTIDITDSTQVTIAGNKVIIDPAANLLAGTGYSVVIAAGVLTDLAGNGYAGLTDANRLNFTTAAADTAAPTIVALTLSDSDFARGEHATVTLTMSEAVTGITAADFDVLGGWIDGAVTTTDGITWTATLKANNGELGDGAIVFHGDHARDLAGNAAGAVSQSAGFTLDTRAPAPPSARGATVALDAASDTGYRGDNLTSDTQPWVTVRLAGSTGYHVGDIVQVQEDGFEGPAAGSYVLQAGDFDADGALLSRDVKIQLTGTLLHGAEGGHRFMVRIADADGNHMPGDYSDTLLDLVIDTTAPALVDTDPVADSTVSGPTEIVLTFDEDVRLDAQTTLVLTGGTGPDQEFNGEAGELHYDSATHTLRLVLEAPLAAGAHYELKTMQALADAADNVAFHGDATLLAFDTRAADGGVVVVPATPTLALRDSTSRTDPGGEASDGVTNQRRIDVGLLDDDGSWEYSLDGGESWQAGDGAAIWLPGSRYEAGQIQVRQFADDDSKGAVSAVATLDKAVTIDTTAPTAAISYESFDFRGDLGTAIEFTGSLLHALANEIVEYTVDNGQHWVRAERVGEAVKIVSSAIHNRGAIGLQVTDAAGNLASGINGATTVYVGDSDDGTFTVRDGSAYYAQRGNDRIETAGTSFARIDGGAGTDTLAPTGTIDTSLAAFAGRLTNIETIALDGAGADTLRVDAAGLRSVTGGTRLTIDGDAADQVLFTGGTWTEGATANGYVTWTSDAVTVLVGVAMHASLSA